MKKRSSAPERGFLFFFHCHPHSELTVADSTLGLSFIFTLNHALIKELYNSSRRILQAKSRIRLDKMLKELARRSEHKEDDRSRFSKLSDVSSKRII